MNSIDIPKQALDIMATLENAGFEAYIVGGCVRDCILGKKPKDWDITTSALPNQTKGLFPKTYDTGIKHGTITVVKDKMSFEVTTYRIDGEYIDFRRPSEVVFTKKIDEDLSRRDFTMNAVAYNEKSGFCDPFGGKIDISKKIIRGVGNPDKRFNEDALRMLRGVRFSAQLNFVIEKNTYNSILRNSELIKNISKERIREEFTKLLLSQFPEKIIMLKETGLLRYIIPEICDKIEPNGNEIKILKALAETHNQNPSFFYCAILYTLNEKKTTNIMKGLRFDNKTIKETASLVKYLNRDIESSAYEIRKVLSEVGEEFYYKLMFMREAFFAENQEELDKIAKARDIFKNILNNNDCYSLKQLKVNGNNLKDVGIVGRSAGEVLKLSLEEVLKNPAMNNFDALMDFILRSSKK